MSRRIEQSHLATSEQEQSNSLTPQTKQPHTVTSLPLPGITMSAVRTMRSAMTSLKPSASCYVVTVCVIVLALCCPPALSAKKRGGERWQEGDVRLVGGRFWSQGTVMLYHDGEWGTVCDDGWDETNSDVVCRQRGFPGSARTALKMEFGGRGNRQMWITKIRCKGNEERLLDCDYVGWGPEIHDLCLGQWRAVGVVCKPKPAPLQPMGMTDPLSSFLEKKDERQRRRRLNARNRELNLQRKAARQAARLTRIAARKTEKQQRQQLKKKLAAAKNAEHDSEMESEMTVASENKDRSTPLANSIVSRTEKTTHIGWVQSKNMFSGVERQNHYANPTTPTEISRADSTETGDRVVNMLPDNVSNKNSVSVLDKTTPPRVQMPPRTYTTVFTSPTASSRNIDTSSWRVHISKYPSESEERIQYTIAPMKESSTTTTSTTSTTHPLTTTTSTTTTPRPPPPTTMTTSTTTRPTTTATTTPTTTTVTTTKSTTPTTTTPRTTTPTTTPTSTPTTTPPPTTTTTTTAPPTTGSTATAPPPPTSTTTTTQPTTTLTKTTLKPVEKPTTTTAKPLEKTAKPSDNVIDLTKMKASKELILDDGKFKSDGGVFLQADSPSNPLLEIKLVGGRYSWEGRLEVRELEDPLGPWGTICGTHWDMRETMVACRELGLHYAKQPLKTNYFGGHEMIKLFYSVNCTGRESKLSECRHIKTDADHKCSKPTFVAGIVCSTYLPDLVPNVQTLQDSIRLQDRPLYYLQCALEENCLSSSAHHEKNHSRYWRNNQRRLLRFSTVVHNRGNADFRPFINKAQWQWHTCHMHFHSMEVFAHYDILDDTGRRLAEGSKASFCLEDTECDRGVSKQFQCAGFGDQGLSVNCSDNYLWDIDCQWIDITDLKPGIYSFLMEINPEMKVAELSFENNVVRCDLWYSSYSASFSNCRLESLLDYRVR